MPADRRSPATVCVIAEIGVNHDGRVDRAIALVDAAADAGADAVKLQLFDPHALLSDQAKFAAYQQGQGESPFDMLERLQLSLDEISKVRVAAARREISFVVTPFSLENIAQLGDVQPDAVKIASPDAVNTPLLDAAAGLGLPMIISTGTCKLTELGPAAGLVRDRAAGGCLLQCVSCYPTPNPDAALGGIASLAQRFSVAAGYSDHTTDVMTGGLAVAAGACVIEKHLTYDRTAAGPDHAASFDPTLFVRYIQFIRRAAQMYGRRHKDILDVESDVRTVSRQSLCAARDLTAGHRITRGDLTVKRPGTGIGPAHMDEVVGARAARDIAEDETLQWNAISR